jgi:CheY-like chemotaxis protein
MQIPYQLRHVVIVDDEPDLLTMIEDYLEDIGIPQVACFTSAQDAYNYCVKQIGGRSMPSVIVSDLSMPKMNGIEFLEKLKKNDFLKEVPFILITAYGEEVKVREAIKAGARDVLTKPFELSFLFERLCAQFQAKSTSSKR